MAILQIPNVAIKGISAAVPQQKVNNADYPYMTEKEKKFISSNIGIHSRRIAPDGMTASDLCLASANRLIDELQWKREDIQVLVFISQTPDHITPCTASILQHQLGLDHHCLAFDINLGCSAYPYGLSVLAGYLQNMVAGKGLLLVGDKSSQLVSEKDKSSALLFSDAGSATALEYDNSAEAMWFDLCTDGGGAESLMVKGGAGRMPFHSESLKEIEESPGIIRNELNLILKGLDIFKFSVTKVPPSIKRLCEIAQQPIDSIDYFILHQANKLINKTIGKRIGVTQDKMPETLQDLGNSSSASIPITIVAQLDGILQKDTHKLLLSGFGVGLSWGTAIVQSQDLKIVPLIEIES